MTYDPANTMQCHIFRPAHDLRRHTQAKLNGTSQGWNVFGRKKYSTCRDIFRDRMVLAMIREQNQLQVQRKTYRGPDRLSFR